MISQYKILCRIFQTDGSSDSSELYNRTKISRRPITFVLVQMIESEEFLTNKRTNS